MIKVDDKCVEIRGDKTKLMANLTQIIKVLFDEEVLDESDVTECVRVASLSDDELVKEAGENFEKAIHKATENGDLFGFLRDVFNDLVDFNDTSDDEEG